TRFSALSRGGVYYAFLFQSQPFFQGFLFQPGGLFAVVPCQWWRIIGSNSELARINFKKNAKRSVLQQSSVRTSNLAWFLYKNGPFGPFLH
ncbi:hypothetical protein QDZ74_004845, partial [Pluralibacter gergoviae]